MAVSLLVVGFAMATYYVTRSILLERQEQNFVRMVSSQTEHIEEFYLTAVAKDDSADSSNESLLTEMRNFVNGISAGSSIHVVLRYGGDTWVSRNSINFGRTALNPQLVEAVAQGTPSIMRYRANGTALQVAGVQLAGGELWYFGIESTQDTVDILNSLVMIVVIGGAIVLLVAILAANFLLRRTFLSIKAFVRATESGKEGSLSPIKGAVDPEFNQLKDSFNQMQQALSHRLERERQFALEVSHELKSPLTTIVLSLETMKLFYRDIPEQAQQAVELLDMEVERFRELLEDLLDISKPPESMDFNFTAIDAKDFLSKLVKHSIPIELDGKAFSFEGDPQLLSQVFTNLFDNATEYAGGVSAIKVWVAGEHIYFAVEDHGPGVPEYDREKIFNRFSRGVSGLSRGAGSGTGLGLAIAKERMHQQNGDIWVESASGSTGARFVLKLPLIQPRYKSRKLIPGKRQLPDA